MQRNANTRTVTNSVMTLVNTITKGLFCCLALVFALTTQNAWADTFTEVTDASHATVSLTNAGDILVITNLPSFSNYTGKTGSVYYNGTSSGYQGITMSSTYTGTNVFLADGIFQLGADASTTFGTHTIVLTNVVPTSTTATKTVNEGVLFNKQQGASTISNNIQIKGTGGLRGGWGGTQGGKLTVSGTISDYTGSSGKLIIENDGAYIYLNSNNSYSGGTQIGGGNHNSNNTYDAVLSTQIGTASEDSTPFGTGVISFGVNSGVASSKGILDLYASYVKIGGLSSTAGGSVKNSGSSQAKLKIVATSNNATNAVISGDIALTIANSSGVTQTLSGANTYTGGTTVSAGTLELGVVTKGTSPDTTTSSAVGTGALTINGGTISMSSTITDNSLYNSISIGANGATFKLLKNQKLTITNLTDSTNTISVIGNEGNGGGTLNIYDDRGSGFNIGPINVNGATVEFTASGSGDQVHIQGATGIKFGEYGGTIYNHGVNFCIWTTNSIIETTALKSGTNLIKADVSGTDGIEFNTVNSEHTVTFKTVSGGDLEVSSVIINQGKIAKSEAGALKLSGKNTYTGGTEIQNGTLKLAVNSTGSTSAITNSAIGTGALTFNADTGATATLATDLAAGVTLYNAVTLTTDGTIATTNGNLTLSGNVSGTKAINKDGSSYDLIFGGTIGTDSSTL